MSTIKETILNKLLALEAIDKQVAACLGMTYQSVVDHKVLIEDYEESLLQKTREGSVFDT
jgi:DNA-binding CsgD family transcriptional regulator